MNEHTATSTDRLARVKRYRRLMNACLLVGIVGFLAALHVDYPLVGVGVYWTAFLAFLGVWKGTSPDLFDERDRAIERTAGAFTLTAFSFVVIFGGPGLMALEVSETFTAGPTVRGALYGYAVLFGVFGLAYTILRYRR